MSKGVLKRIGGLLTIGVLVGVGLLASVTSASATSATAPAATVLDLNGSWTDYPLQYARPAISEVNGSIAIDMSYSFRPNAYGSVIAPDTISVTFPDDAGSPYTGSLHASSSGGTFDEIKWSNGTVWVKVYTGLRSQFDGDWGSGACLHASGGYIEISFPNRPTARGFAYDPSDDIFVNFPDDAAYFGRLQEQPVTGNAVLRWSNGTTWVLDLSARGLGC
jgi:hypothetical protein